jgi:hypothetical protein
LLTNLGGKVFSKERKKRRTTVSKETYYSVKRDLLQCSEPWGQGLQQGESVQPEKTATVGRDAYHSLSGPTNPATRSQGKIKKSRRIEVLLVIRSREPCNSKSRKNKK